MSENSRKREAEAQTKADIKGQGARGGSKIINKGTVWGFFILSLSGLFNFFGSNPRILYLPAFGFCCLVMFLTHGYVSSRLSLQHKSLTPLTHEEPIKPTPAAPPVVIPDFISGTRVTHAQLKEIFPFGYVIYSFAEGQWDYVPHPGDHVQWKADWNKVSIVPDFSNRTVVVIINDLGAEITKDGKFFSRGANNRIEKHAPLVTDEFFPIGFKFGGEPEILFGTLSDNQRAPIFVIGFRIVEDNPSAPKK